MKILFDGYWWVEGPIANRNVLREILTEWRSTYPLDEIVLAVPKRHAHIARTELGSDVTVVPLRLWPHGLSNAVELPPVAKKYRVDLVLAQNYAPVTGRSVVLIQDLLFKDHPEWFTRAERLYFAPMSTLARRATAIATSTETEALRIRRFVGQAPDVSVVGLAVSTELLRAESVVPSEMRDGQSFAISVGRLNARKNVERALLGAVRSGRISPTTPLVVIGSGAHSGVGLNLPQSLESHVSDGSIKFLGHVSSGELKWLYENAAVTVYISMDEGFGLPPIEATAFGSSVVASDIPVFRETLGDAATFVDPLDVSAIAESFRRAWAASPEERRRRRAAITAQHSWKFTVRRLRDLAYSSIENGANAKR